MNQVGHVIDKQTKLQVKTEDKHNWWTAGNMIAVHEMGEKDIKNAQPYSSTFISRVYFEHWVLFYSDSV